jgi:hypothetical protein
VKVVGEVDRLIVEVEVEAAAEMMELCPLLLQLSRPRFPFRTMMNHQSLPSHQHQYHSNSPEVEAVEEVERLIVEVEAEAEAETRELCRLLLVHQLSRPKFQTMMNHQSLNDCQSNAVAEARDGNPRMQRCRPIMVT